MIGSKFSRAVCSDQAAIVTFISRFNDLVVYNDDLTLVMFGRMFSWSHGKR